MLETPCWSGDAVVTLESFWTLWSGSSTTMCSCTADSDARAFEFGALRSVAFTIDELDRILRLTVPDLLPGVLDLHSYSRIDGHDDEVGVRDDRIVVRVLSNEQRSILL